MRKFIIGITVLSLLLIAGLFVANATEEMYAHIIDLLKDGAQNALSGSFQIAKAQAEKAKVLWDKQKNATATVADHTPMEEIDHLFAEMEIYAKAEEKPHFAAVCKELSRRIRAVAEAHRFSWWNVL